MDGSNGVPAVQLRGITRIFPGVVANDDIDLDLYRGEIHCLLGENGAGKSTLMSVLAGVYRPDSGSIVIDGEAVDIGSPREAIREGIGMVYQHPTLVLTFTVLENLLLGRKDGFRLDRRRARLSLAEISRRLGAEVDPNAVVGRLALGRQQQVEIVKALWSNPQILILDEPTAMLTPREVDRLGRVLVALKNRGLVIVVITHKLHEALQFGDRVTVLKDGRVAGRLGPEQLAETASAELRAVVVRMMFGDDTAGLGEVEGSEGGERCSHSARTLLAEVVLGADRMSVAPRQQEAGVYEVSFAIRRGEVFGLAGVDGNGQKELAEAIAGQRSIVGGTLRLGSDDVTRLGVSARQRLGLGYVTDDRVGEGTVSSLPLTVNLLLKRIGEQPFWSRARRISRGSTKAVARGLVEEFDIRVPDIGTHTGALSGGNLQKLILARELSFESKVVVYHKPTHGLDLRTTWTIRRKIRELAEEKGVAALLISTDLDELISLCDRIGVMSGGRLVGIVENEGPRVEERVGELMIGGGETA